MLNIFFCRNSHIILTTHTIILNQAPITVHVFADVTSDQLRDLTRRLTSASVAGQTKQVDLEGNEVLSRCNHAVEVSRIITHNILSPQIKQ